MHLIVSGTASLQINGNICITLNTLAVNRSTFTRLSLDFLRHRIVFLTKLAQFAFRRNIGIIVASGSGRTQLSADRSRRFPPGNYRRRVRRRNGSRSRSSSR
ncbi:hypothetical protein V8G54_009700 [Vigna mungo]|uniref:Uncharacterized protein n=1 Tax=Vigna mungo TaxID=3915 RepID=A0AAQ3NYI2_VIGMU